MQRIENGEGKLVCMADLDSLAIEIVRKGQKTLIVFQPGEGIRVINVKLV